MNEKKPYIMVRMDSKLKKRIRAKCIQEDTNVNEIGLKLFEDWLASFRIKK